MVEPPAGARGFSVMAKAKPQPSPKENFQRAVEEHDWSKPENIKAVASMLWVVTHEPDVSDQEMLRNLSFVSGVAMAVLMELADKK